ncbi:MAG: hypothetical protein AAGJ82_07615 [Bacteroidota bacterium]
MSEIYTINRYALLLRPQQELLDWSNAIYPQDPVQLEDIGSHDGTDVYLIPEMADIEDGEDWLRDNFLVFLESELGNWCSDEKQWPDPLDWGVFIRFFDYSLQSSVIDIVSKEEDEEYEDYDEEDDEPDVEGFPAKGDDEFEWGN